MPHYEFKVVPAPDRVQPLEGRARPRDPFCDIVQALLNDLGAEGWDFVRAEHLRVRRSFWSFGPAVTERTLLIFRRETVAAEAETAEPAAPQDPAEPRLSRHEVPHFVRTAAIAEPPPLKAVPKRSGAG